MPGIGRDTLLCILSLLVHLAKDSGCHMVSCTPLPLCVFAPCAQASGLGLYFSRSTVLVCLTWRPCPSLRPSRGLTGC